MSNLGNQASKCSLDKVAGALPPALKKSVLLSSNLSTFVWVIKNQDDANKIVKVLRENGFSNISLDSKGTTITAQSSSGSQSAGNDSSCSTGCTCNLKPAPNNDCGQVPSDDYCLNYYYPSDPTSGSGPLPCIYTINGNCIPGDCETYEDQISE